MNKLESLLGHSCLSRDGGVVIEHRKQYAIHNGDAFMAILTPASLIAGGELQLILVVPSDVECHLIDMVYAINKISIVSTRKLSGTFTLTNSYTSLRLNQGRNSRDSFVRVYQGYTGTPTEEIQMQVTEPKVAEEKQPVFSGSSNSDEEFIYGEGTYLFGLKNNEASAASGLYWKVRWNEYKLT